MGDDAYALSRIALENAVILAWVLNEEQWCERIDIYANSYSQAKVRLDAVAQKYHGGTEAARSLHESITSEDNAIVEELFNGQWQSGLSLMGGVGRSRTWRTKSLEATSSMTVFPWRRAGSCIADFAVASTSLRSCGETTATALESCTTRTPQRTRCFLPTRPLWSRSLLWIGERLSGYRRRLLERLLDSERADANQAEKCPGPFRAAVVAPSSLFTTCRSSPRVNGRWKVKDPGQDGDHNM